MFVSPRVLANARLLAFAFEDTTTIYIYASEPQLYTNSNSDNLNLLSTSLSSFMCALTFLYGEYLLIKYAFFNPECPARHDPGAMRCPCSCSCGKCTWTQRPMANHACTDTARGLAIDASSAHGLVCTCVHLRERRAVKPKWNSLSFLTAVSKHL